MSGSVASNLIGKANQSARFKIALELFTLLLLGRSAAVGLSAGSIKEFCLRLLMQYQRQPQPLIMSGYFAQSKWWFHGSDSGLGSRFR